MVRLPKRPAALAAAALNRRGSNHLLSLLPADDRARILKLCKRVSLEIETVLHQMDDRVEHMYFPLSGMISLVIASPEGGTIEIAAVGNEGVVDTLVALGGERSHWRALIQLGGDFLRIGTADFLRELERSAALTDLTNRFAQALTVQISQSVMCNGLHSVEQRICRWLLMTHDRAGRDEMHLTQQFLADMLGVRRPTVTVAAGMLQKAGFVEYSRGKVLVLDRQGLEDTSCECYAEVNRKLEKLLNWLPA